jgi:hypothetical protein
VELRPYPPSQTPMQDETLQTFCTPHFCYGLLCAADYRLNKALMLDYSGGLVRKFNNQRSFCLVNHILLRFFKELHITAVYCTFKNIEILRNNNNALYKYLLD